MNLGPVAKELLSPWAQGPRTGMTSAQTAYQRGASAPAPVVHASLLLSHVSISLHRKLVTLSYHQPAVSYRAGSCTFPKHAPGERSDRRVPFLKALPTGAAKHLSQAEGMPGQR